MYSRCPVVPTYMTNASLTSFKTNDVFLHVPDLSDNHTHDTASENLLSLVFFIPGNPGLISYYHTFFELITQSRPDLAIAGFSLGHFETDRPITQTESLRNTLLFPPSFSEKPPGQPYTLRDQIQLCYARLEWLIYHLHMQFCLTRPGRKLNVILAGHSVGAYIALELVQIQHELTRPSFALPHNNTNGSTTFRTSFTITATLLLTPTIENIARSQSGVVATPLLTWLPFFPILLQAGASALTCILPQFWLRTVVQRVTGMKSDRNLDTTISLLQTSGAVRQALFMARYEMLEINENTWADEVWGAASSAVDDGAVHHPMRSTDAAPVRGEETHVLWKAPKHFFLFAKQDHWIADATRDSIVKAHEGRARVVIDTDGEMSLVHAWCLDKNDTVAGIVVAWLSEIV